MRDFARLNVYVADGNVLQTEEQDRYVALATASSPWLPVTVAT